MSETVVAFARRYLCRSETVVAFAGEKWALLERFSVASVLSVSTVAVQGRAVVMVVSSPPRHSCPCTKKFALPGLMVGVSENKFALHAHIGPKLVFSGVLGEVFCGNAGEGAPLGEFFRDLADVGARGRPLSCRGPGGWAPLLAVLTLECAAKPHWWHGGQPAHATTHRVNVHRMRSQKWGLLGSQAAAPPGIRQRRDPEGSRLSLRAVAAPSAPISQRQKLSARAAAR